MKNKVKVPIYIFAVLRHGKESGVFPSQFSEMYLHLHKGRQAALLSPLKGEKNGRTLHNLGVSEVTCEYMAASVFLKA